MWVVSALIPDHCLSIYCEALHSLKAWILCYTVEIVKILQELIESVPKAHPKHQKERWTTYLKKQ